MGGVYYTCSIIHGGGVLYYKYNDWLSIRAVFPITIFTVLTYINAVIIQILLSPPSTPVSLPGPVRYIRFAISIAIHLNNFYNIFVFSIII